MDKPTVDPTQSLRNKEVMLKEKIERLSKRNKPEELEALERAKSGLSEVQAELRNTKGTTNAKPTSPK